jgi:tRNA(Ile)-lysidine synthase
VTSVEDLLPRCHFPPAGTAVDLAVSGGPDSLALLVLAAAHGCEVTAHHVDHGLRPEGSVEAAVVAAASRRCGAAFRGHQISVAPGPNLEARARAERYQVLPPGVLTGHTADDQAETILLNLVRGAGLDGLAGMAPCRRPLLHLRRSETRALCAAVGLDPVQDPTNLDPAHRRNRVRQEVLPLLADVADRDVVPLVARTAELVRQDLAHLDTLAGEVDPTDAKALTGSPEVLARRSLRRWLRQAGPGGAEQHPPSAAEVARVLDVAHGKAVACELSGGWRVARSRNRLRLVPPHSGHELR